MTRAIAPKVFPDLPKGAQGWIRSTGRADTMFHAHVLGYLMCNPHRHISRFKAEETTSISPMQYHGVCPRCFKLGDN